MCGDEAQRRGLTIAEATGNRQIESHLAGSLARLAAVHGDPADAFDYLTRAMRHFYHSGSFSLMPSALAVLAVVFDRLGTTNPTPPSADSPLTLHAHGQSRVEHRHHPLARSSRRRGLRITCPRRQKHDQRRHGYLRLRPDRPRPRGPPAALVGADCAVSYATRRDGRTKPHSHGNRAATTPARRRKSPRHACGGLCVCSDRPVARHRQVEQGPDIAEFEDPPACFGDALRTVLA